MSYEKAKAEVITFDNFEVFMIASGDVATAQAALMEKEGFDEFNCPVVTYSGGVLSCSNVTYHRTGELVHWGPNNHKWSVK